MKPAQFNEQEPVARIVKQGATVKLEWVNADAAHNAKVGNLYTTPSQRKPLPLTDEQRKQMWHKANPAHRSWASFDWYSQGVADTEAAHGIKE